MRVIIAVLVGVTLFSMGFRLTDEVTVIVGLLGLSAVVFGFSAPTQWGRLAVGLGVGVALHRLYPPPYHPDARHLALYGPPRPLPLPLGLTGNHVAETIAVGFLLMAFLLLATGTGSMVRRLREE